MASSSGDWAFSLPAASGSFSGGPRALAVFTILLLWPPSPTSSCPDVCSCSSGEVNCRDHQLRFVPVCLPTNATSLLLDRNRLAALQDHTFVAQKVLHHLSLRSNVLVRIHRLALVGLGELQILDLSDNRLSLLHPEAFLPVPGLRTLKLGNNKLLRLDPELPEALPHLEALFVHGNALSSLSPSFFENLPSLSHLTLEDNPWTCSCGIQPLFWWLVQNMDKVPEANSVTCAHPAYLTQYPISTLGNKSFVRCQELQDYTFFLLIGPSTFLASICVCILVGSVVVARLKLKAALCIWPWALMRRAGNPLR